jgi:nucleotide-binding STING sensor domain-containing protein
MNAHFKWLAPASLKKNFDLQEIIAFILPTTYAYYDGLPKIVDLSKNMIVTTSVLVFLLLFLFKLYKNFSNNEKAVAEVLETGYFNNFFYPFALVVTNKLQSGDKLTIDFKNKNIPSVETSDVDIRIILPESKDKMTEVVTAINNVAKDASVDNGSWVKAQALENGKVIIYECPRTLATIEKHLINGESEYTNDESFKFHKYFSEKFMKDYKATGFGFVVSTTV